MPFRRVMVTGEVPSPPPHVILYEWSATTTAGTDVKAIWGVCARTVTTHEAHARSVQRKRMVVEKESTAGCV